MYGILSDFIYCLNSSILSSSDDMAIPQKSLFLHTFSWDLSLFLFQKNEGNSSNKLSLLVMQDNARLLFLRLGSLSLELFVFHNSH